MRHSPAPGIEAHQEGRDAASGSVHESPACGAFRRMGTPKFPRREAVVDGKAPRADLHHTL